MDDRIAIGIPTHNRAAFVRLGAFSVLSVPLGRQAVRIDVVVDEPLPNGASAELREFEVVLVVFARVGMSFDVDLHLGVLLEVCELMGIEARQSIAVGDGANDLPMMSVAGLSIAFHGKPAVRGQAMVSIEQGGMERALEVLR